MLPFKSCLSSPCSDRGSFSEAVNMWVQHQFYGTLSKLYFISLFDIWGRVHLRKNFRAGASRQPGPTLPSYRWGGGAMWVSFPLISIWNCPEILTILLSDFFSNLFPLVLPHSHGLFTASSDLSCKSVLLAFFSLLLKSLLPPPNSVI